MSTLASKHDMVNSCVIVLRVVVVGTLPGNVPLPLHQQVNVFNASVVGVVQPLRQMLLHVWLKVLVCPLTLKQRNTYWHFDIRRANKRGDGYQCLVLQVLQFLCCMNSVLIKFYIHLPQIFFRLGF